jgi:hypothetical protein
MIITDRDTPTVHDWTPARRRPVEIYEAEQTATQLWHEYNRLIDADASRDEIEAAGLDAEAAEAWAGDLREQWHRGTYWSILKLREAAQVAAGRE